MAKTQKQSFLHGAAVLAAATAIVKVIGALYKVPLVRVLGTEGYGLFSVAFNIYNVLLTISTAGLPVAMSKMVSESQTLGQTGQIKRIYRVSLAVFLTIGAAGSAVMLAFSKQLTAMMSADPAAWYSIAALAPAVLFVCIMSSFRGYFQGRSYMTPTAISQILEAISKLVIGLGLVYLLTSKGFGIEYASAGAIMGVTIGTVLGAAYLFFIYIRQNRGLKSEEKKAPVKSWGDTMRELLSIAVPITLGASGLQIINLLDTKIILSRLQGALGLTSKLATDLLGNYSSVQTLFNLPAAFIIPLTISVIPSVTAYLTLNDHKNALRVEQSSLKITALLGLPCGIGLAVLAKPILQLLYDFRQSDLEYAVPILMILGVTVIFNCLVLLTNSILQAHGRISTPIYTMLIGGIIKVIINWFLVGNPSLGIIGAPIGTLCCYVIITALNFIAINRVMSERLRLTALFVKPVLATAAMAVTAFMAYDVLSAYVNSILIQCAGAIAAAVVVYVIFVLVLRIITYDDCLFLPKGEKIAKILRIKQ